MSPVQQDEIGFGPGDLAPDLPHGEAATAWNDWGAMQFARGNVTQSEQAFRRALELDDGAREPAVNLGLLLLAQKRTEEGIAFLELHKDTLSDEEMQVILRMEPSLPWKRASLSVPCRLPSPIRAVLMATAAGEQYRVELGQDHPVLAGFHRDPDWLAWTERVIELLAPVAPRRPAAPDPASADAIVAALEQDSIPVSFGVLTINDNQNGFHLLRNLLQKYRPKVIAVAYNAALGPDEDRVVPYLRHSRWDGSDYFGASFRAYGALAEHFGYRLAGCEDTGVGLFLVRQDLIESDLSGNDISGYKPGPMLPKDPGQRRYLTSAHYLMKGVSVLASPFGYISYFENDEYIGKTLASGQYWDAALVQRMGQVLQSVEGQALDIGAHIGTHAIALSHFAPKMNFICFEPQLPLFRLLERNIFENGLGDRIEPVWSAVAHTSGQTSLSSNASDGASAGQSFAYGSGAPVNLGGIQLGAGGQECRVLSIDDLHLASVGYVKMDVEGAEALVLAGMQNTLDASSPIFLYEERADRRLPAEAYEALKVDSGKLRSVTEFLRARDYSIQRLGLDWLAMPPAKSSLTGVSEAAKPELIPARIFQTWKSKVILPSAFELWSQTFKDRNPSYVYELWDDDDNRSFIATEFPWFLEIYNAYKAEIFRADAVRYFYLYTFGGVYADLDTECLRPLDALRDRADIVLGRMGYDAAFAHSIPNAIMASRPRQEFWLFVMGLLIQASQQSGGPEALTGPILLKSAVDLYRSGDPALLAEAIRAVCNLLRPDQQPEKNRSCIELLPGRELYPIDWTDPIHRFLRGQILNGSLLSKESKAALFPQAWMVTYWSHTW